MDIWTYGVCDVCVCGRYLQQLPRELQVRIAEKAEMATVDIGQVVERQVDKRYLQYRIGCVCVSTGFFFIFLCRGIRGSSFTL